MHTFCLNFEIMIKKSIVSIHPKFYEKLNVQQELLFRVIQFNFFKVDLLCIALFILI